MALGRSSIRVLLSDRRLVAALSFLCLAGLVSIGAEWVAPYSFDEQNIDQLLKSPRWPYILGTDRLGRDVFSRIIYGGRMSLSVGILTALLSLIIGLVYGAIAGWYGGWIDKSLMKVVDIIYSLPSLVIMILIKVSMDQYQLLEGTQWQALFSTVVALSLIGWLGLARLVRGQILVIRSQVYIEAGRALGLRDSNLIFRHLIPNLWGPVVVMLSIRIPANILLESFLSFIGLGLQPPHSSWGVLAANGADMLETHPHLLVFPAGALFLVTLAFQTVGDSLREFLDPRSGRRQRLNIKAEK